MGEYIDRDAFKEGVEERYCLPCKEVGKDYNMQGGKGTEKILANVQNAERQYQSGATTAPTAGQRCMEVLKMAEYIDCELLKERFRKRLDWLKKDIHDEYSGALYDCCEYDTKLIDEIPVVNVAPVVHGRWISKNDHGYEWVFVCSNCSYIDGFPFNDRYNYCPNCGAKMDEKENDNGC